MKNCTIGNWLFLLCSVGLLWSGSARELLAGQNYPKHVTVFGSQSEAPAPAPKPIDPVKKADIQRLMKVVGTQQTFTRMMDSMMKDTRPLLLHSLPPGEYREQLVEIFFEKFRANVDPQHFMDIAAPVYAEYLSDDDIKGLIQFYKTPLGQKWISVQPTVQKELRPALLSWGREVGRKTMLEVLAEHPDLAEDLKRAEMAQHAR